MQNDKQLIAAKRATQSVFLACGLGLSSWAPMVPYAKDRLDVNDAALGLLLLLLGFGAMVTMPLAGNIITKVGSRNVIGASTLLIVCTLPLLSSIDTVSAMAVALFLFGCGIGSVDVAMNAHAVQVQNLYDRPIMSSVHGFFSIGGLFGSLIPGFLMQSGLSAFNAAIAMSILILALVVWQYKNLFGYKLEQLSIKDFNNEYSPSVKRNISHWWHKTVLLLGFMCFAIFLSEGAVLDWGAIFLRDTKKITSEFAGLGYAGFSVAMACTRLIGDKITAKLAAKSVVIGGCGITIIGLIISISATLPPAVIAGFALIGVGTANIVPLLFSEAGRIPDISPAISISAVTTMGYAGQLAGPALLGLIANRFSLSVAFAVIAMLFLIVAVIFYTRKVTVASLKRNDVINTSSTIG